MLTRRSGTRPPGRPVAVRLLHLPGCPLTGQVRATLRECLADADRSAPGRPRFEDLAESRLGGAT